MTLLVAALQIWSWFRSIHVLKSWGWKYGVWLGVGWQSERTKFATRSWLVTVWPPYLRGIGINFAVWRFCVRGGVYRRIGNFKYDAGYEDPEDFDLELELAALQWGSLEQEETNIWSTSSSDS